MLLWHFWKPVVSDYWLQTLVHTGLIWGPEYKEKSWKESSQRMWRWGRGGDGWRWSYNDCAPDQGFSTRCLRPATSYRNLLLPRGGALVGIWNINTHCWRRCPPPRCAFHLVDHHHRLNPHPSPPSAGREGYRQNLLQHVSRILPGKWGLPMNDIQSKELMM